MRAIGTSLPATCALLGACVLPGAAALAQANGEAERSPALIWAFDEVVRTRFDHRLLALQEFELAEGRLPTCTAKQVG